MTDAAVTVREATPADAEAISAVDCASHLAAYTPIFGAGYSFLSPKEDADRWRGIMADERDPTRAARRVLVACCGDVVVGFAAMMRSRDADAAPRTGEVSALYVHPDWWRRGVGRVLLSASLAYLEQQNFTVATLWTLEDNVGARAFYEAEGWHDDGGRQLLEVDRPLPKLTEVRYCKAIGGRT